MDFEKNSIDLVFGGPPCQGFSVAGKMDPDDERSKLVWEFFDVVKILRPKMFVMENVKALGELERWHSVRMRIFEKASELGYDCFCKVLNSADFGVPQKRERVFFVGFLGNSGDKKELFINEIIKLAKPRVILRDCLSKLPPAGSNENPITCTAKISLAINPVMRKSPYAGMLFNGLGRPLDLDNQANTLPASMGGNKTPILDELLLEKPKTDDFGEWRNHAVATLICGTGLRSGTIRRILMEDIDLENNTLFLRHTKNNKLQIVNIPPYASKIIKKYIEYWRHETTDADFLFCNRFNEQLTKNAIAQSFSRYAKARDVKNTSLHSGRHYFGLNYILSGGNPLELQHILGHSDLAITKRYVALNHENIKPNFLLHNPLENLMSGATRTSIKKANRSKL